MKTYKNYQWSYSSENPEAVPPPSNKKRRVYQYDLDGNLINTYESLTESVRQTGCNLGNISSCCLGKRKTCGGFRWSYQPDLTPQSQPQVH